MKTRTLSRTVAVLAVSGSLTAALAVPIESSNSSREYLVAAKDLSHWSCGTYLEMRYRDVTTPWHRGETEMSTRGMMMYVGYSLARWITAYATAGLTQADIVGGGAPPTALASGVGMHFNVLDHDMLDPTLFEDRLRINAGCQVTYTESNWGGEPFQMFDLYAAVLGSVVNDLEGHKYYVPRSIALYAGPIYSDISSLQIRNRSPFGAAAGIELLWSPNFSWQVGLNTLNGRISPSTGLSIHF